MRVYQRIIAESLGKRDQGLTGSAAPAKNVNIGTDSFPLYAKASDELKSPHDDGSTHHVGGFKPPEWVSRDDHGLDVTTTGDVSIHHDGESFFHTRKTGKSTTGEKTYEYSNGRGRRVWVSASGHLQED